jgi:hypothetical protein
MRVICEVLSLLQALALALALLVLSFFRYLVGDDGWLYMVEV